MKTKGSMKAWKQLLRSGGAINTDILEVREVLEKDVAQLWNGDVYTGERLETKEEQLLYQRKVLKAFCSFCEGDKPREEYNFE